MKMIIMYLSVLIICSCSNKKNRSEVTFVQIENETKTMPRERVINYVNRMDSINNLYFKIIEDYGDEDLSYLKDPRYCGHTSKDIEDLLSLVSEDLETNGYKTPTEDFFLDKVKTVFQISPNSKVPYTINHEDFFLVPSSEKDLEYRGTQGDYEYETAILVFSKKNRFSLASNIWWANYDQDNSGKVTNISPKIIHRNKYLFNDSKSSFTWLALNDSTFLEGLFDDYGYTADKNLDIWILNNRLDGVKVADFGKSFYYKRFDNTVKFNPEVFEVFEEKVDFNYISNLQSICIRMGLNNDPLGQDLTFRERSELFARLMYLGENVVHKNSDVKIEKDSYYKTLGDFKGRFMGGFMFSYTYYPDEFSKYYEEFKRNNFYNLPHFEEYWQAGQDYFEMMTPPQKEIEEG